MSAEQRTHNYYFNLPRGFVVFNDQELSEEPITADDILPVTVAAVRNAPDFYASATWSSDCEWYFIITNEGILLRNVSTDRGLLCKKKSAAFIGEVLASGMLSRSAEKRRAVHV